MATRQRGRAQFLFCWRLRCRCGSRSEQVPIREQQADSVSAASRDPYSLPVSLFFAAAAAARAASVTLRLCTVPQVLPSRKEWRVVSSFSHGCWPSAPLVFRFGERQNYHFIDIAVLYRRYAEPDGKRRHVSANGMLQLCTTSCSSSWHTEPSP